MNPSIEANSDRELEAHRGAFSGHANLVWFAAAAALYVGARLWGLSASCLWFDEIFSVHAARHSWSQIAPFIAADIIHPPLFYFLLKVWIGIGGESLFWLRLFPACFSIASIIPLSLLCRELKLSAGERNLTVLLLAVSGFLIKYAQEVRMYSLLFFLTLCSLWLFVRFIKAGETLKRNLVVLAVANLLLVYTHYSGWAIVILQAVALVLWKRNRIRRSWRWARPSFSRTCRGFTNCTERRIRFGGWARILGGWAVPV